MGIKKRLKKVKALVKVLEQGLLSVNSKVEKAESGLRHASRVAESKADSALQGVDLLLPRVKVLERDTVLVHREGSSVPFCVECTAPMSESLMDLQPFWVCSVCPSIHPVRRRAETVGGMTPV